MTREEGGRPWGWGERTGGRAKTRKRGQLRGKELGDGEKWGGERKLGKGWNWGGGKILGGTESPGKRWGREKTRKRGELGRRRTGRERKVGEGGENWEKWELRAGGGGEERELGRGEVKWGERKTGGRETACKPSPQHECGAKPSRGGALAQAWPPRGTGVRPFVSAGGREGASEGAACPPARPAVRPPAPVRRRPRSASPSPRGGQRLGSGRGGGRSPLRACRRRAAWRAAQAPRSRGARAGLLPDPRGLRARRAGRGGAARRGEARPWPDLGGGSPEKVTATGEAGGGQGSGGGGGCWPGLGGRWVPRCLRRGPGPGSPRRCCRPGSGGGARLAPGSAAAAVPVCPCHVCASQG